MKTMLTELEKSALKDLKHTEYFKPLMKLFDESLKVLQADLLNYKVETEAEAYKFLQKKSQIDGASKLLGLLKSQLEKQSLSKLSNG